MSTPLSLRIQLLGNFRLLDGDKPISSVNTPRLQSLLAYLVLHRDASPLRQHLAFQLWPDSSESQARTNLRKLIFELQRALPHADHFLRADTQTIGWNPHAPLWLDVAELQQRLTHLRVEPLDLEALRQVAELYQGPLLPSCYDDWIHSFRQELHQQVMSTLERLITLLENQRAYDTGIYYAQRLLAFDPLEEKSYQRLMRLHALEGDYTGALRVYQECVAVLQRELEVEPDAETTALYARLRQRDPALAPKPEPKLPQAEPLPLVGRQREWQTLQDVWRKTVQGQTHFVCIWGEAGIGKTRLAEELLDWAGRQGVLTARTRSYQTQGALAYAPVSTLLRSPTLASRLASLSANWLSEVARLLPELLDKHPGLAAPQPMNEGWQRQRFLEALGRAVLADDQPLLLVFDDLHWCDQETLTWLNYLLHTAPQTRLLVVGTSRVEAVDDAHPLTTLRLGLHREALLTEIELAPLSAAEVTTLAGELALQELTPAQTQQLYAMTEGNPLFVVETVRAGEGWQAGQPLADLATAKTSSVQPNQSFLPSKVQAVIRARLTQLSPPAQKIVSLAAVIGRSFSFAVLAAAAHTDEDTLIDSLDELNTRRILREQGAEGYDFSHDRIREVAYAELSHARRRQLRRHVAEALEVVYASRLDEVSGLLAEHYEQAGNAESAIDYLQRAGEQAAQISAHREALHFHNRALLLVLNIEKGTSTRAQSLRINLLTKLANSHLALDEYTAAQQLGEESLALARVSGEQSSLADSLHVLGAIALALSEYAKATPLYQQVLELYMIMGERSGEADVLCKLGEIAVRQGKYTQGAQLDEQALLIAREIGDRKGEAQALRRLGNIISVQGDPSKALHLFQQALLVYRTIGDRNGEATVLNTLGVEAFSQSRYAQATQLQEEALLIYREIGARRFEALSLSYLAEIAWAQDEHEKAASFEQQALLNFRMIGDRSGEAFSLLGLALIADNQGEYKQAISLYEQALLIYQAIGNQLMSASVLNNLGEIACSQGEYTQAIQQLEQALLIFRSTGHRSREAYGLLTMGRIAQSQGAYSQATQLYQQTWEIFRAIGEQRGEQFAIDALGGVACIEGNYSTALQLHQQALTMTQTVGDRRGIMMALKGLGWVAYEQGEYREAAARFQQALTIAQAIGDRREHANLFQALGYTTLGQQELPLSHQHFRQAIAISRDISLTPVLLASLVGIAQLRILENQLAQALPLLGLALHAPQTTADTKKRTSLLVLELQAKMPPELVTTLLAAGEQLHLAQVVQELLQAEG